jgi:hypothetical protein
MEMERQAPDEMVVTTEAKKERRHQRKVSAYPSVSRYSGSGSVEDAGNFVCRTPLGAPSRLARRYRDVLGAAAAPF